MVRGKLWMVWFFGAALTLSSCCQPAHKNSNPVVIDSLFQETYGRNIDIFQELESRSTAADSAYYPIYTFGITNAGTADDDFTLQIRYTNNTEAGNPNFGPQVGGFDITRHVPAGATVLFKTPIPVPDSITNQETFFYPSLTHTNNGITTTDTAPNMDFAYFCLSFQSTDSAEIHFMRPTVDILSGAINNGPEACNTPASQLNVDVFSLPLR
jgi:hypothetical protein